MAKKLDLSVYAKTAAKIKTTRLDLGLTQETVAAALGMNRVAYSNLENCKRKVMVSDVLKLMEFYGVRWADLVDFSEQGGLK